MSVVIEVDGVDYTVPSSASDTNWAAQQVTFEQALANGVNAALAEVAAIPDADYTTRGLVGIDTPGQSQRFGGNKEVTLTARGLSYIMTAIDDPDPAETIVFNSVNGFPLTTTLDITGLTGDVLMVATPTIQAGIASPKLGDQQEITIFNRDKVNKITLQDEGTLPDSALRLASNTLDLIDGSSVRLRYFADTGIWHEVCRAILI